MQFVATEEQVQQMGLNATEWSHLQGRLKLKPEDIPLEAGGLFLDYFEARLVKLFIHRKGKTPGGEQVWEISDNLDSSHQSWLARYRTAENLVRSVLQKYQENVIYQG